MYPFIHKTSPSQCQLAYEQVSIYLITRPAYTTEDRLNLRTLQIRLKVRRFCRRPLYRLKYTMATVHELSRRVAVVHRLQGLGSLTKLHYCRLTAYTYLRRGLRASPLTKNQNEPKIDNVSKKIKIFSRK